MAGRLQQVGADTSRGQSSDAALLEASNYLSNKAAMEKKLEDDLAQYRKQKETEFVSERMQTIEKIKKTEIDAELKYQELRMNNKYAKHIEQLTADRIALEEELQDQLLLESDEKKREALMAEHQEKLDLLDEEIAAEEEKRIKLDNKLKKQQKKDAREVQKAAGDKMRKDVANKFDGSAGGTLSGFKEMAKQMKAIKAGSEAGEKVGTAQLLVAVNALSDFASTLNKQIDEIAANKGEVDTRLQGLDKKYQNWAGSYWEKMSSDIVGVAGVSPLVKQEDIVNNIKSLVGQGIAYNVEQRGFLATIKDKIATTFSATNGTLLRLVRIQQQDTTAARLGMESALNAFLNNMYETTEYLGSLAESIKGSIEEMSALSSASNALELEYQIQKWMGSLYSVGMSESSVQSIANSLGQVLSGQVEGLTSESGNLIIMAANQAGLSISDMLAEGLNADKTNKLLNSMVEYLAGLYNQASDSRVIQQQIAAVYGVKASDLLAATNLADVPGTLTAIQKENLTYSQAIGQLYDMAGSMYSRTSIGEMLSNAWSNFSYTMSAGIANNPALYALYKSATLLDNLVGGIALPMVSVMGNTVDLHTTVADLMRVAALSGSVLGGLGKIIAAGSGGGISGKGMLSAVGVSSNLTTVARGSGGGKKTTSGATTSESGSVVSSDTSSSVKEQTMADADQSSKDSLAQAQEDSDEISMKDVNENVIAIYTLLQSIADGSSSLAVRDVTWKGFN